MTPSPIEPPPATTASETSFRKAVPEYLRIYSFDVFNLGAYYCAAGPALGLYIKHLGASTTYMGLVMACMPACQLLQFFVAPHIERWGIKQVMVGSLILRNCIHLLLAVLPFLAGWGIGTGEQGKAGLLLGALFVIMLGFDLCQGLGFAGWMAWVNWLVPEKFRGRYFALEQMMNNIGQMCFAGVAGWILGDQGSHYNFGSLFLLGAVCGWASIAFLGRISAIPKKTEANKSPALHFAWVGAVWRRAEFRKMMYVIWAHQLMLTVGYFLVYFQKDRLHLTDQFLMVMTTFGIAGGVLSVYFWGTLADRFGSASPPICWRWGWDSRSFRSRFSYWPNFSTWPGCKGMSSPTCVTCSGASPGTTWCMAPFSTISRCRFRPCSAQCSGAASWISLSCATLT